MASAGAKQFTSQESTPGFLGIWEEKTVSDVHTWEVGGSI